MALMLSCPEIINILSNVILIPRSQVDRDGNGTISLSEYFGIFEEHGITVSRKEANR